MTYVAYQQYCHSLALVATKQAYAQLCAYVDLLCRWGKAYNLTAQPTPQTIWQHIIDCLPAVACAPTHVERYLDVGSGAGFPGIVFAIMHPSAQVAMSTKMRTTLLDSNGKKARFLERVAHELGLSVSVACTRLEKLVTSDGQYDVISSRAFATLADSVKWMVHLLTPKTLFIAIKGHAIQQEMNDVVSLYPSATVTLYPATEQIPRTQIVCVRQLQ